VFGDKIPEGEKSGVHQHCPTLQANSYGGRGPEFCRFHRGEGSSLACGTYRAYGPVPP